MPDITFTFERISPQEFSACLAYCVLFWTWVTSAGYRYERYQILNWEGVALLVTFVIYSLPLCGLLATIMDTTTPLPSGFVLAALWLISGVALLELGILLSHRKYERHH